MINAALFSSVRPDWCTPRDLFAELDAEFHFELDAAASAENALCERFYTEQDDALGKPWAPFRTYVNPPYGRSVGSWTKKARRESQAGALVVMLLPARTDTAWFHDDILHRAEIRFLRGRVRFVGAAASAPFPSMVVVYRGEEGER